MALPAIPNHVAGFQAIIQTTAGTAETLTPASDGVYYNAGDGLPPAPFEFDYVFDGKRGRSVKSLLKLPLVAPIGRSGTVDFKTWIRGAGTAYTSSAVKPPNEMHTFLQLAGFDATFSTNKWLYTLTAAGLTYKFGTYGYYAQGKSHLLRDVVADFSYSFNGANLPDAIFKLMGVVAANRATLALPSITYYNTAIEPALLVPLTSVIGSFVTPVVQKGGFAMNRQFGNPRVRSSDSAAHMGWVPTGFDPVMSFSIEQTALESSPFHASTGLDPDKLREAATAITVSQQWGTSPNRWKFEMTNAQCTKASPPNEDAIAMWDLEFVPSENSVITITAD